jgi:predicted amidohydrolase YtcJ
MTRPLIIAATLFLAALPALAAGPAATPPGDLVLMGGRVRTLDPARPWAEAVLIRQGRIARVGTDAEIAAAAPKDAKIVRLGGALVLPGFIDCHTHFLQGGYALSSIQLKDVRSREEFVARFAAKVASTEKGAWILNGTWDEEKLDPPVLPARAWIDATTPENPVFVRRYDLHIGLANSLALKMAGITRDTPSPAGGEIVKDPATGEPTGILKEAAMNLVTRVIPPPSLKDNVLAIEAALAHAAECGVTSVHEMAFPDEFTPAFEAYQELYGSGGLTSRIYLYIPVPRIDLFEGLRMRSPFGNDYLRIAGLKGFCDGGLGARTAVFFRPYDDDPGNTGILHPQMSPEGTMEKRLLEADRLGLQVAIHAIGDKANDLILDIFEKAEAVNGPRDRRWRIEHAQHLRPEDIARYGKLRVIASVQPYHAIDDGRWAVKRIGTERLKTTYAFKSLLDGGAKLALGSDWMVAPLNPLTGIHAAVTRATLDGKNPGGWYPEQKLSLEEAIRGYTLDAAFAEFSEREKGSIEAGKFADLVVLDQDLYKVAPERIKDIKVTMTIVGGRIVFARPQGSAS